jgi:predicted  nucleic acid-binding Zn-ribbon protein
MDDYKKRRNGEIFPDIRRDTPEHGSDPSEVRTTDWREKPLETAGERGERGFLRQPRLPHQQEPRTGRVWLAFAFLLVLLGAVSFLGYQTIHEANIQVSQIPSMLKSMTAMSARLDDVQAKLGSWAANAQDLSDRMDKLQKTVHANYRSARKHAEVLTTQLEERITDQMESRNYIVDTRLNQLDTEQKGAQAKIAQLHQELADARQEIASLRQDTNGDLALLHQQVAGNNEQVNEFTQQVERRRVDFEVAKNQPSELSPNISIKLAAPNVRYQRFSGWLYYLPDRRFLWIHDHGVQQPVVFYDRHEAKRYEVVITSVQRDAAAGYLLLPADSAAQPQTVASAAAGK